MKNKEVSEKKSFPCQIERAAKEKTGTEITEKQIMGQEMLTIPAVVSFNNFRQLRPAIRDAARTALLW